MAKISFHHTAAATTAHRATLTATRTATHTAVRTATHTAVFTAALAIVLAVALTAAAVATLIHSNMLSIDAAAASVGAHSEGTAAADGAQTGYMAAAAASVGAQPAGATAAASVGAQTGYMAAAASVGAQPVGADKLYGIGSVSKVFTAAAVMKLVDDGKLELDEPLITYIPDFVMADARYADITPRMLLSHSSGLMGMTDNNVFLLGDSDPWNHKHLLSLLKPQTLKHRPGETSVYSNDSFSLAEVLVERVSGIGFTDYIERNFAEKMGLENIKTPQSAFDRKKLAPIYYGANEMQPECLGVIGSGGIYATMEDLCRFAGIFMDGADGSVLSKQSTGEMAKNQHKNPMVDINADNTFNYGLGWDAVETYPFNHYGIKALSKGGGTGGYHTNLTVLPQYNLAAAVSSSGTDSYEQLIAQEIILEILREEGIIGDNSNSSGDGSSNGIDGNTSGLAPLAKGGMAQGRFMRQGGLVRGSSGDTLLSMPEPDMTSARIPDDIKAYAGYYAIMDGIIQAEFSGDTLILTPIGVRNERPQEYMYNTDGEFVSTNGDYIGISFTSTQAGIRGVTTLKFADGKYIIMQTYESVPGLSISAFTTPVAEKLTANPVSDIVAKAWADRDENEYLLVNEKYSSVRYINAALAKFHMDGRIPGYVGRGIYKGAGKSIKNAMIVDEYTAIGYQSTPTMAGRDTNNLAAVTRNGVEYMLVNDYRYIDAASIGAASEIGDSVQIPGKAARIGAGSQPDTYAQPDAGAQPSADAQPDMGAQPGAGPQPDMGAAVWHTVDADTGTTAWPSNNDDAGATVWPVEDEDIGDAIWFNVDEQAAGRTWRIVTPENGSWFTYDDKMNCVATSLEKDPRATVILPENGRIAFVGAAGAQFLINRRE